MRTPNDTQQSPSKASCRVAVTGASGFIGNCAARRLLNAGYQVHLLLRANSKLWRLQDILNQVTVHRVDITDESGIQGAFEAIKPNVILHAATQGAYDQNSNANQILQTNIIGTCNILEAGIRVGARLFINTGSSSEYGFNSHPMSESDRLDPNSIYSVAKAAQTHLCGCIGRNSAMALVTFRLFTVYGPWEEPSRLIPKLIYRARTGLPLELSSPNLARDFVYVDDVLDLLLDFERLCSFQGEIFNIGTGTQSTFRQVVDCILEVVRSRSEVRWGAVNPKSWDTNKWQADVAKTKAQFGWHSRCSLFDGVTRMARWMESKNDFYGRT